MNLFQISKIQAKIKNNIPIPNKFEYSLDLLGNSILSFKINTKTQTDPRYPEQTFEIYIEDFNFDHNVILINRDNTIINIESSDINHYSFHSSSQLNIHLKNRDSNGRKTYSINFGHNILRNQQNNNSFTQPIVGFTISYQKLFEKLNIKLEDLSEDILNKVKFENCLIVLKYGNINLDKSIYDYEINLEWSKFKDQKSLSFLICESGVSKGLTDVAQIEYRNSNVDKVNSEISKYLIEDIAKETDLNINYQEIASIIGGNFLTTPFGCESKYNLPTPFPLFITKI